MQPVTPSTIYRHPAAHPLVLDLLATRQFGLDWLVWEPETVEDALRGQQVSTQNLHKLNACKALHTADTFWKRWEVFGWINYGMHGMAPDLEIMQVPTCPQMAVTVAIAGKLRDDVPWSDEVRIYAGSVCRHEGLLAPPAPLDFVTLERTGWPVDLVDVEARWPAVRAAGHHQGSSAEDIQLQRMLDVFLAVREDQEEMTRQLKGCSL